VLVPGADHRSPFLLLIEVPTCRQGFNPHSH
jgi:hypothetical protein